MLSFVVVFKLLAKRDKVRGALKRSRESWFSRVSQIIHRPTLDEGVLEELEELLISGDVGVNTSTLLIDSIRRGNSSNGVLETSVVVAHLKQHLVSLLSCEDRDSFSLRSSGPGMPLVILMVGVNGVGKTTSIAKLAHYFKDQGKKVLLAAADTFRAAAIEQIQAWGQRVGAEVIAHRSGGDPAAVAYDALEAAKARGMDVVLVDTAGRLHTKKNLMDEMEKVSRVLARLDPQAPHEVLLVLDATTGQNGLAQARSFTKAVGCTGVFLAKLDGTARGGIVVPIVQELGLPVLFVGTGEEVEDMAPFDPQEFVEDLFSTDL